MESYSLQPMTEAQGKAEAAALTTRAQVGCRLACSKKTIHESEMDHSLIVYYTSWMQLHFVPRTLLHRFGCYHMLLVNRPDNKSNDLLPPAAVAPGVSCTRQEAGGLKGGRIAGASKVFIKYIKHSHRCGFQNMVTLGFCKWMKRFQRWMFFTAGLSWTNSYDTAVSSAWVLGDAILIA